jgi:GNAT superfamily N-acetyltransferase
VEALELRHRPTGSGSRCREILATLPTWFGIPQSVEDYASVADRSPTVIASHDGRDVSIATIVTHSPYAAEVYVMAVVPEYHRQGIGRALLEQVEDSLAGAGVEFLQVKTQSARRADEGYARTRAFYLSYGFRPLEEWPLLWGPENPALQMIKNVISRPRPRP